MNCSTGKELFQMSDECNGLPFILIGSPSTIKNIGRQLVTRGMDR